MVLLCRESPWQQVTDSDAEAPWLGPEVWLMDKLSFSNRPNISDGVSMKERTDRSSWSRRKLHQILGCGVKQTPCDILH